MPGEALFLLSAAERGRKARFEPAGRVAVDDALGRGLIKLLGGDAGFGLALGDLASRGFIANFANLQLDVAAHAAIPQATFGALTLALFSAMGVGHTRSTVAGDRMMRAWPAAGS